ncbi:MAG: arginine N-succinyltransferase [Phycisphaerales bacterium]
MYLIRPAKLDDLPTLLKLARMVYFINLPPEKDIIAEKIRRSQAAFKAAGDGAQAAHGSQHHSTSGTGAASAKSPLFMFCIEDTETRNCLGTSSIISRMGGPGHPNLSLQLRHRELFSRDLQQGVKHTTAQLHLDESGPTEIGGLILQPSMRGHPQRIGKQISLARFHFMGLFRAWFADKVIAEMMGPITPDGNNTLWEYFGRRFINLTYAEADKFCQYSREFMTSLLPREEIYLTLLPPEARALIGQVGPDTLPARRMLEELGFRNHDKVDPFDGGPQLECDTDKVPLARGAVRTSYAGTCNASAAKSEGFVSVMHDNGDFRCLFTSYQAEAANGDAAAVGELRLPRDAATVLGLKAGMAIGVSPASLSSSPKSDGAARKRRRPAAV